MQREINSLESRITRLIRTGGVVDLHEAKRLDDFRKGYVQALKDLQEAIDES